MWMALPRHGCRSEQPTADNAPRTVEPQARQEWVAYRTHAAESSLRRRRSWVYRCIRLIVTGLRQVHWWYSKSTKDSGREEQNQNPTASIHDHPPQVRPSLPPQTSDVKRRVLNLA
jgi:phage portal protein BeeE